MTERDMGLVPRMWSRLFGEEAARLTERMQPSHWLSYVLILSQSAAVLLVFGHAEIPLIFSANWAIRLIATMGAFVLLATVFAADMALLTTLRRMPALARNRQHWQLREHLCYVLFVLLTEAVTLGVVLATLDADPTALISPKPLIPPQGWAFRLQIVLRVVLVSWTFVQLVIVRTKLPVLLSTLTSTGRELVGAHVEKRLASLDIRNINLPAAFRTYAAMSKPPRRIETWWNGWLVRRELKAEAEEARQVENVIAALDDLEVHRTTPAPDTLPPTPEPPNGRRPNSRPEAANGNHHREEVQPFKGLQVVSGRAAVKRARTGKKSPEEVRRQRAFNLLNGEPDMSIADLQRVLHTRPTTAAALYAQWKHSQQKVIAQ